MTRIIAGEPIQNQDAVLLQPLSTSVTTLIGKKVSLTDKVQTVMWQDVSYPCI